VQLLLRSKRAARYTLTDMADDAAELLRELELALQLMTVEGMGHDLPRAIWPRLIDAIAEQALLRPAATRA
jgi:hypothetical protein